MLEEEEKVIFDAGTFKEAEQVHLGLPLGFKVSLGLLASKSYLDYKCCLDYYNTDKLLLMGTNPMVVFNAHIETYVQEPVRRVTL